MNPDRKRILIVDDDAKLATLLQESLRPLGEGYDVVTAGGANGALSKFSRRPFDLVITDLMMPEVDGLELLEALKAINPSIVTVAMTAFDSREIRAKAERFGIYRYLAKPFSLQEFRQCVIDVFKKAEQTQEAAAFSKEQLKVIERNLSSLRTSVRAHSVALIDSAGKIISFQSVERDLDMASLCNALVTGNATVVAEIARLSGGLPICGFSYHEGDGYNVCVYTLNEDFSLVIVFGQGVKVGQVWFYAKQVVDDLQQALPGGKSMGEVEKGQLEIFELEAEESGEPESVEVGAQAAPDSWEAVAEEVARDFGGLSLTEAQAVSLVGEDFEDDDRCATLLMLELQVSLWRDAPALAAALKQLTSLTSGIIHDLRNSLGLLRYSFMLHNQPALTAKVDFCLRFLESMAALRFKSQASYVFHQGNFESPELSRDMLKAALHGSEQRLLLLGGGESITGLTIHGWLDDKWLYQGIWALLWSLASRLSPEEKIEVEDRRFDDHAAGFHATIATPARPGCIQEEALRPEAVLSGDEVALGFFLMRKAVAFHRGQLMVQPGLIEVRIPAHFWEELISSKDELKRKIDRLEEEIAVRERSHEGAEPDVTPLVRSFAFPLLKQLDVIRGETESLDGEEQDSKPWVTILRSCHYSQLLLWNLLRLGVSLEPPQKAVDVGETLHLVLGILDSQIRHDEIKVVTEVGRDLPPALADEVGLQQVFMNVILNALEAMPEEGRLTLRARQESGMVVVEVADTGHGIPPENLDRIYDIRFSTKEGRERGIGLYVVKSVVDRLEGQLEVESRVGEGTTLTVWLPVASA